MHEGARSSGEAGVYASEVPPSCSPKIRAIHEYWLSIHPAPEVLPGRQHVDPLAIPALLPWVWLVDVQRSPLRFRQRLTGTEQVRAMERDVTGMWIDEAFPKFLSSPAYPQFVACVEQAQVQYRRGPGLFHLAKEFLSVERVLLPLARDGRTVDMLLALTDYHRRR
jgi:hypothetical protein